MLLAMFIIIDRLIVMLASNESDFSPSKWFLNFNYPFSLVG